MWDKGYYPEPVGTTLCTSPKGMGYNVNEKKPGFGDADKAKKGGDCSHQIRIRSEKLGDFPKR